MGDNSLSNFAHVRREYPGNDYRTTPMESLLDKSKERCFCTALDNCRSTPGIVVGHRSRLFAAHHLHQFGLGLKPVVVSVFFGSVAGLVDLVSADSYLFIREGTRREWLRSLLLFRNDSLRTDLDVRF